MSNEFIEEEIRCEYVDWIYNIVCDDRYLKTSYKKLFWYLYDVEFDYILPMDGNRAEDGVNLRYQFGDEYGYQQHIIALYLDTKPCSVLEMMVALALRCETHIMDNPDLGNRVGQWFWEMIVNLGLGHMTDDKFDIDRANEIMYILLERKFDKDGTGGLFRIKDKTRDMRTAEIWYQMNWYLSEIWENQ